MSKRVVSVSKLKTLLSCPKKYWHHYVNKTPEPFTGDALILGSAVHETIETFFNSGKDLNVEEFFHNKYDQLVNEVEQKGQYVHYGDWSNYEDNIKRGKEMLSKFLKRKEIQTIDSSNLYNEVPFIVPICTIDQDEWYLHGIIDRITLDDLLKVSDYKTTKAKVEKWFTENDLQLVGYAYALWKGQPIYDLKEWLDTGRINEEYKHLFGKIPDLVEYTALHYLCSTKKPWQVNELYPHPFEPSEQKLDQWRLDVIDIIKLLLFYESSGIWIKNKRDPSTTQCNDCVYKESCYTKKMSLQDAIKQVNPDRKVFRIKR